MARVPVETVLTARDVNTAAVFGQLSHAADRFNNLLGMGSRAFSTFQSLALGGGVLAVGAGLASTAQSLLKVNQELEGTTNNLAGSIQVFNYAKDYKDALLLADDALLKIKKDAAALPGTDTDFIRAFAITFPEQAQLGVKTLDEAIKRSNSLTSVLLAKGVDSGQIGRDIGQMLRGHAAMDVRSFAELKGQLGVKDADEFNKKSAKERLALLDAVIAKNKDVISAFGTTWEAASSTGQSYLKQLVLAGSSPLFEVAKQNMKALNDYVEPLMPMLERSMRMGGSGLVALGRGALGLAGPLLDSLSPGRGMLDTTVAALLPVFDSLASAGARVYDVLLPVGEALSAVGTALWDGLMSVLPALAETFDTAVAVGAVFVDWLAEGARLAAEAVGPALVALGGGLSWVAGVLTDTFLVAIVTIKPAFSMLGEAASELYEMFREVWSRMQSFFGGDVDEAEDAVSSFADKLAEAADEARRSLGIGSGGSASGGIQAWMARFAEEQKKAEEKRTADSARANRDAAKLKRPTVHQDFRGSRFNIEQKFAPGFDPGRVLTAVRVDAARLEKLRLNAGAVTPLFGGG